MTAPRVRSTTAREDQVHGASDHVHHSLLIKYCLYHQNVRLILVTHINSFFSCKTIKGFLEIGQERLGFDSVQLATS